MGLETRHGRTYYYKKRRSGKRVVSEYCGSGFMANLMYLWDQQSRDDAALAKENKRRMFDAEKQKQKEIDSVMEDFRKDADTLEAALFVLNGYHLHSRQWRRKAK